MYCMYSQSGSFVKTPKVGKWDQTFFKQSDLFTILCAKTFFL